MSNIKTVIQIVDDEDPLAGGSFLDCMNSAGTRLRIQLEEIGGGLNGTQLFNNTNCNFDFNKCHQQ